MNRQLRAQKLKVAKLSGQLAQANSQVVVLKAQASAQAQGGLSAVLAGSPDDMWASVQAIWQAFPLMPSGTFCGFDKDVAARLKLSRSHVYQLVQRGDLEAIRVTGGRADHVRVDSVSLANYLAAINRTPVHA
jgi:excisionase family DNA binding protein